LRKEDRRFLQFRETFTVLTNGNLIRAGILECALFELSKQMRADKSGKRHDLEWKEDRYALLTGPDPSKCDLFSLMTDDFLIPRLYGITSSIRTVRDAISWLAKKDYLIRGASDRFLLLNVKQIERDQADHPYFTGRKFKNAVSGSHDQLLAEPVDAIFSPLYLGLVKIVKAGTGISSEQTIAKAALVLQRILRRAELRDHSGEEIAAPWTARKIQSTFSWGSVGSWNTAFQALSAAQMIEITRRIEHGVVEHRAEPLLPAIYAAASNTGLEVTLEQGRQKLNKVAAEIEQPSGKIRTTSRQDVNKVVAEIEQTPPYIETEGFSETLPDFHTEREVVVTPELLEIFQKLSHSVLEQRRISRFVDLPLEEAWSTLTFSDVVDQADDAGKAATLYSLARQLDTGARTAMAFHSDDPRARAFVAVLIGHWLDTEVAYRGEVTWIKPSKHRAAIQANFQSTARVELVNSWRKAHGPLIIENVAEAGTNEQLRDEIVAAIDAHRDAVKPIVFIGIPGNVSFLEKRLKEDRLTQLIVRILNEFKEDRVPGELDMPATTSKRPFDPNRPFA
ncbi:MAG: hypothetical protein V9E96_20665, partial [Chitinophagaceae bacterium]